ncbi:MAG: sigma-70 family RNA polymerase sigma factor [Paludibacteraceae bacterium]|nr:sigma-70 family RNA polymerase sigma factor [Paludibacteraceae bacterium]MBR4705010.1 sigma-70 family RNA polymerase sigma factor [Paludibacteraceae bacterium]
MTIRPTDIELIREVLQDSNERAFETLMKRYISAVYGASLRLMKDEENAQEVTQMAFIQAYRQLDSWHGENFGAWVTIIANHIALRLLEKEKRRQTDPLDENVDAPDETYDEQKEQRLQSLEAAVARLPEADRQIIQWHYYEDIPLQTIAQRVGQTENNIKVRMYRIRERIKKQMQS